MFELASRRGKAVSERQGSQVALPSEDVNLSGFEQTAYKVLGDAVKVMA